MLTIYATRDDDGTRCLWRLKPILEEDGKWWRDSNGILAEADSGCDDAYAVIRGLFPRGMKPGEIRKFKILRLGEET